MVLTLPTPGGDNNTWGTELNTWLEGTQAGVHVETLGVVANDVGSAASNTAIINAHMETLTNTHTDPQNRGKAMFFPAEPVFISGAIVFPQNLYSLAWYGHGGGSTFNGSNGSGLKQLASGEHVLDMTQEAISHNAPKLIGMNFEGYPGTAAIKIRDWNRGVLHNCYIFADGAPCIDAASEGFISYGDCAWWHLIDVHFTGPFSSAILSNQFTFQMLGGEMTTVDADGSDPPGGHYGFNGTFVNCSAHGVKTDGVRHIIRGIQNHFSAQCEILEGENGAWTVGDESWNPEDPEDASFAYTTRGNTFDLKITGRGSGITAPMHFGAFAHSNVATLSTSVVGGTYTEDNDGMGVPWRNSVHTIASANYNDGFKLNQPVAGYQMDMFNSHVNASSALGLRIRGNRSAYNMLSMYSPNSSYSFDEGLTYTGDGTLNVKMHLAHGGGRTDAEAPKAGFYGTAPIVKQTGVAVSAAGIHAALVALGLISA